MKTLTALATAALALMLSANDAAAASHPPATAPDAEPEALMLMPLMDPERGRKLFASKGCVVCHAVNGVGGTDAPPLDYDPNVSGFMNPFEFAARMWAGAEAMIFLQQEELGEQIRFTGSELADIIAFAHSPSEQRKFSIEDIPDHIRDLLHHREDMDDGHEEDHVGDD